MKTTMDIKRTGKGDKGIYKPKSGVLTHHLDLFLEECRVQKQFFSGQMSIEEYIGMKKKVKK